MRANRGGRPTKFSAELGDEIIGLLRRGVPRGEIAARVGIGARSLQEWLRRGRAGEPAFAEWAGRFDRVVEMRRRERLAASWERAEAASKERWRRFKEARQRWWMERLGPGEFWARRLRWLADRGRWEAFRGTVERLRSEGFRIDGTP